MEKTPITQHKIYVEKYSLCKNFYNHTLRNNFLSLKPQIHDPEKYSLTKQTRNTYIEEPNASSI